MSQHRLLAYLGGTEAEGALLGDGAGKDTVAGMLLYGDRLASDHRLVDFWEKGVFRGERGEGRGERIVLRRVYSLTSHL
jgi:hypothetical protein